MPQKESGRGGEQLKVFRWWHGTTGCDYREKHGVFFRVSESQKIEFF